MTPSFNTYKRYVSFLFALLLTSQLCASTLEVSTFSDRNDRKSSPLLLPVNTLSGVSDERVGQEAIAALESPLPKKEAPAHQPLKQKTHWAQKILYSHAKRSGTLYENYNTKQFKKNETQYPLEIELKASLDYHACLFTDPKIDINKFMEGFLRYYAPTLYFSKDIVFLIRDYLYDPKDNKRVMLLQKITQNSLQHASSDVAKMLDEKRKNFCKIRVCACLACCSGLMELILGIVLWDTLPTKGILIFSIVVGSITLLCVVCFCLDLLIYYIAKKRKF
ncbi:MAG: hypothetical protein AAF335_04100 [Bacteroidota bacterium]